MEKHALCVWSAEIHNCDRQMSYRIDTVKERPTHLGEGTGLRPADAFGYTVSPVSAVGLYRTSVERRRWLS